MDRQISERIEELHSILSWKANGIYSNLLDQEDIEQEMALALIERANRDADFSNQSSVYLVQLATWRGIDAANRARGKDDLSLDSDNSADFSELLPDPSMSPEEQAEQVETIQELLEMVEDDPRGQQMVRLFYLGYSEREIAQAAGISQAAISQRKKRLAENWRARQCRC